MDNPNYKIPIELLEKQSGQDTIPNDDIESIKCNVLTVLNKYDVEVERMDDNVSPSVITIEAIPSQGFKVSKVRKYTECIERDLGEHGSCRVVVPVPGKGTIAVEMPRSDRQMVGLRSLLESEEYLTSQAELPIALGISTENKPIIADLRKMPHLLIGGATGSGKSVLLNSIIISLLYRKSPDEMKFLLIDPKMVELTYYAGFNDQYLVKVEGINEDVITDPDNSIIALNSLCVEMEKRRELLTKYGCRSSREYNEKLKDGKFTRADGLRPMPYIVVVIDEIADLMMTKGKEFEIPLARLAQKSRAEGIHLIISTQKPSTEIITGILKANFPARIAFKVQSISESRTILDMTGAQVLTGRGDMLRTDNGWISRIQGAFVGSQDIEKVCDWITRNNPVEESFTLSNPPLSKDSWYNPCNDKDPDPLFEEAARLVIQSRKGSTSILQRRYSIGYNRACRIMDQLEKAGIVSPADNGRPRKVLLNANSDSRKFPFLTNRFWNKLVQFWKKQKQETDFEILTELHGKSNPSFPYEDYEIIGNTSDIDKILIKHGIINISKDDVLATLNSSGTNYVTAGLSDNGVVVDALKIAVESLKKISPMSIGKMLFNIWVNSKNTQLSLSDMKSVTDYIESELKGINVVWGVAVDESLDNGIKVTLIASSK